jgi:dienelactone hydrolase
MTRPRDRRHLAVLTVAGLALSACSGGSDSGADAGADDGSVPETTVAAPSTTASPTTTTSTTTAVPPTTTTLPSTFAVTLEDLAARGPHPVGVTTLTGEEGLTVEVWYPADPSTPADSTDGYDIRDFVPDTIRAILTGDVDSEFTYAAARDAAPAAAPETGFPVVVFSHGYTGMRLQSATLTAHLASWGVVVVAPDHPSRDLRNVLGGTASGEPSESVIELLAARKLVDVDGPLAGMVDRAGPWAAVGHSAGGSTVARLAADPVAVGLGGYVSLAAGIPEDVTAADVPSWFIAGALDAVVEPARSREAFESAPAPSRLWVVDGAGHNAFDDFCRFGNGSGIIGVADASGLGPLLDAQPQLRALGSDGCLPPAAPLADTDPAILAGTTAGVLAALGLRAFDDEETPPGPAAVETAVR